jgi:UDP-N-acetylglucosamine 2-epimerase (non-hydrolysing)
MVYLTRTYYIQTRKGACVITVLSVIGTRPEAIKMAPVVNELRRFPNQIRSIVCATAQHRELLDSVLNLFDITPDHDFNLMRPNQTLTEVTTAVLAGMEQVLTDVQPDWVLAQGDTTTVMATGLACYYQHILFGHVEAGLRTGDKLHPYPEEINRVLADALADLHFAPTARARENLLSAGIAEATIHVTGNTVIDALLEIAQRDLPQVQATLADIPLWADRIVLVTAHRRESFGAGFQQICDALAALAARYPQVQFVYPVHPNPNVTRPVYGRLGSIANISLTKPLEYATLVHLMKRSCLILTDSGGIQEEAPAFGKPVLVLRQVSERPEGITAGVARLVGTDPDRIVQEASTLLDDDAAYAQMARAISPYGDGHASQRIVQALLASPR